MNGRGWESTEVAASMPSVSRLSSVECASLGFPAVASRHEFAASVDCRIISVTPVLPETATEQQRNSVSWVVSGRVTGSKCSRLWLRATASQKVSRSETKYAQPLRLELWQRWDLCLDFPRARLVTCWTTQIGSLDGENRRRDPGACRNWSSNAHILALTGEFFRFRHVSHPAAIGGATTARRAIVA